MKIPWLKKRVGKNISKLEVVKIGYFSRLQTKCIMTANYKHSTLNYDISDPFCILVRVLEPITVFKKVAVTRGGYRDGTMVIRLELMVDSLVWLFRATKKCRTNFAYVLPFRSGCDPFGLIRVTSFHDHKFYYISDTFVKPSVGSGKLSFSTRLNPNPCAGGIHFFFSRNMAKKY